METAVALNLSLELNRKNGHSRLNVLLKPIVGMETIISHQLFVTGTFITKVNKYIYISMVDCLIQHIQDLNNQPNGIKVGFLPRILE